MQQNTSSLRAGVTIRGRKFIYTIQSVLGQGSFGITYLASTIVKAVGDLGSLETEMKVAVKEFFMHEFCSRHADGTVTEMSEGSLVGGYARKFRKEAENLARLSHPGIVKVLEVFESNNTCYYSMEYIDGGSLDQYVKSRSGLPEQEAVDCIRQIGDAVQYMHDHRMLHLDLKPLNVMRSSDGSRLTLIDFGLSKQYTSEGNPESSTSVGLGTPGYAPLEQSNADSDRDFAPTLDVYALGATFFKLLTGETPPKASDVLNEGLPIDLLESKGISQTSISAIERAMEPRKSKRIKSVTEFLTLLSSSSSSDDEVTFIKETKPSPKPIHEPNAEPKTQPIPTSSARRPSISVKNLAIAVDADKCTVLVRDKENSGGIMVLLEMSTEVFGINPVTLLASVESNEPQLLYNTMMTLLRTIWDKVHEMVKVDDDRFILSVPSYYRLSHIRYMQQMCELMHLPLWRILYQNDAAALGYLYSHPHFDGNIAVVSRDRYATSLSFAEIGNDVCEMLLSRNYTNSEWKTELIRSAADEYSNSLSDKILEVIQVDTPTHFSVNCGLLGLMVQYMILNHDTACDAVLLSVINVSLGVKFANTTIMLMERDCSIPFKKMVSFELKGLGKGRNKICVVECMDVCSKECCIPLFQFDLEVCENSMEDSLCNLNFTIDMDANWRMKINVNNILTGKSQCNSYLIPFNTWSLKEESLPLVVEDDKTLVNNER